MKETFKNNGIYPYHFMYDTGILEELKDVILRRKASAEARAGALSDWTDRLLEWGTRIPGRALWREMKEGARLPFLSGHAGSETLALWLSEMARGRPGLRIHLCGHSTGAILIAHLLQKLQELAPDLRISSCSLFAPAASVALFERHYYPHLVAPSGRFGLDRMQVFNLTDRRERADSVGDVYRKSLLYLVSRGFEERVPQPVLGMQTYMQEMLSKPEMQAVTDRFEVHYSDGISNAVTESVTHGGFDNDVATMNSVLRAILGGEPRQPFTKAMLDY